MHPIYLLYVHHVLECVFLSSSTSTSGPDFSLDNSDRTIMSCWVDTKYPRHFIILDLLRSVNATTYTPVNDGCIFISIVSQIGLGLV